MKLPHRSAQKTCTANGKACVAQAARIIGGKWTPGILYALSTSPQRFNTLRVEAGGLNPRTLSARLDALEADGIVTKHVYSELPPRVEYALTQKGLDILPILHDMIAWGEKYPGEAQ